ncbi:baseplate assembly protein [Halodesulfovibrio marinisediminis]|uniref:Phage-related baseplate assembly protein n=1 Tax=Halodesulfovibrio marinisediminis DSM 17456 TaxID=1121457 RepID=A0A1N6I1N1_9BACT|nr:baseplate J/gp47 family protein [Halodesulfovibrio marinisediminis]SIO25805.1 Phage-related baseplate assembly protein [Halodesulfovibrio marinisediminis DSM 17456]
MSAFNAINLSRLAPPKIIETLSVEQILQELIAYHEELDPNFTAPLPSDPAYKIFEANAYRELLLRQRINEAVQAVLVAYATGTDLEHLAAAIPLKRKLIDAGDPDAYPPKPPVYESCDDFRKRIVMAPEGFSTAGPDGAYIFHALSVLGVKDAHPHSPKPVHVQLYVLGKKGNGVPEKAVLDKVSEAFSKDVRPFTDFLEVLPAVVREYEVKATVHVLPGPSAESVLSEARKNLEKYVADSHKLGTCIARSGIDAALHIAGVSRVEITLPAADIITKGHEAAFCSKITLKQGSKA